MNKFFKKYIGVILAWIVVAIAAIFVLPNSFNLVASHGQTKLPKSAQSQVANTLKNNWGPKLSHTRQVLVVFSNGKAKLNDIQKNQINTTLTELTNKKDQYDIKSIIKPSVDSAAAVSQPSNAQSTAAPQNSSQSTAASTSSASSAALTGSDPTVSTELNSKDGTTMLAQLNVGKRDSVRQMDAKLKNAVRTAGVTTYITSPESIISDTQHVTQANLWKTAVVAVVVILLALILLFRSLVVPIVSLLSSGIAYVISLAIVLNLVSHYDFPFSDFTETLMLILILGLGTDFSILLVNEFKRQLQAGKDQLAATLAARKKVGKTILVAGLTLTVLFSLLGFANYSLYESLTGVSIGILVLLLVTISFTPFFLFLMGETLFWPSANLEARNYSRSWGFLATKSATHPLIALIIVIVVATPFVLLNQHHFNHNDAAEITRNSAAKTGYRIVNQHYANGMNAPVSIYIKTDHGLRNQTDLQQLETVTRQLSAQKGIHSVNSATEPHGEPLKQLYVNQQLDTLTGDNDAVSSGMANTSKKLKGTSIPTSSLDSMTGDAQSITSMVSTIQNEFNRSGVFATPAQVVDELQQKLQSQHRRRLTSVQRLVVTEALSRALNDQQQQTQMNSALSSIGMKTDSINSTANAFKSELQNVQNQVRGYASNLDSLNSSLTNSNNFLKALAKSSVGDTIYVPDNVINADYFKTLISDYLSDNEKTTRIDVVLNATPGSRKSMELVSDLENQVNYDLRGTQLKGATVAVGGYSSAVVDNQAAIHRSSKRISILLGVVSTVILMVIAGSILQPVYMMGLLSMIYLMSLGFTRWFSAQFLGQKWLTVNTPFLTFIILLALGVDYSIYLLMKYKQTPGKGHSPERMVNAAILIGTIIIFAIAIVGLTVATLLSSGVLTLIQMAIAVIFGLIVFGITVPAILPGLMRLTYEGFNFKQLKFKHRQTSKTEDED
ncbi:MMPL family transporter [Lentilactobacillus raoultii]|uniref:MMPL family transporter n=1 Tax=Lentilactobacillus raoultii TaxID=1987503 RepID=A0ABW3PHF2_9LACO|nr:MMPL family transporter [Lentilactobacillus raoultii]